ncbi:MAG TPA: helicase HerA-like domain-containing protein [Polyangiaceae bacterium]|nr:helicase HerA-like domain-containing protein [Polyangiaceae bacterium]
MAKPPTLNLGAWRHIDGEAGGPVLRLPAHHLVTHGVVVGMTGSGKTGLVTVLAEEALGAGIPTLIIDVKGDLPNLLLAFPDFEPTAYLPWIEPGVQGQSSPSPDEQATALARERRSALEAWSIGERELKRFSSRTSLRVLTPGATAGEPLHVLSPLERRSERWDSDPESARAALSAAVSLVLRLLGRDPDPAKSKEHVLLSVLAERRLVAGEQADLAALMQDVAEPPISEIGALSIDAFMRPRDRNNLAAALNTLLASPTFASWRVGANLDVADWLTPRGRRTPAVIVSVAHLDDEERNLVLGVLLEEVLSWVRSLRGSQTLRALLIFDEVYGFLPPHPANPPTKRPLVALMKQARAFGVGVVVATQNPMDLDYRALSNAGLWCIGRLQTDADRARVIEGLATAQDIHEANSAELSRTITRLNNRWFVVRNSHANSGPILLQPRYALSWLRGPMTRHELRLAREHREQVEGNAPASTPPEVAPAVTAEGHRESETR